MKTTNLIRATRAQLAASYYDPEHVAKVTKKIPPAILECWRVYDGDLPGDPVATRASQDWYAILLHSKDKEDGELFAIDFNWHGKDQGWEVSNDHIGPFESVGQFQREPLIRTFL